MSEEGEQKKPQDWKVRQYYEQEALKEKILGIAEYREIAPTYPNGYGKRPDAINFPGDFQALVEDGAVAFHASVERWRNPLLIDNVSDLDQLREAWDLVIDIDCDHSFKLARDTAQLVIRELQDHGIENISIKFSGNRGFHIGVRGEAFPEELDQQHISNLYPRLPRGLIDYIRDNLRDEMIELIEEYGLEEEMETDNGKKPFKVSDIENDWGQRHLFRMPYSLHDDSWLVSLPIEIDHIQEFEKEEAEIENVEFETGFLDEYEEGEAANLAVQAMDFLDEQEEERREDIQKKQDRDFERPEDAIPEQHFPPSIKNILEGLEDGRKRGLFILLNFYRTVGYSWDEIESKIWEWNERNKEELGETYVKSQLRWHRERSEDVPPPNYDSNGYYKDMGVYEGDNLEEQVSNPVSYAFRKANRRQDSEGDSESEGDQEIFECPYCGKEYKSEGYYKKHVEQCNEDLEVKKL